MNMKMDKGYVMSQYNYLMSEDGREDNAHFWNNFYNIRDLVMDILTIAGRLILFVIALIITAFMIALD